MILYMDVYITDARLIKNLYDELEVLRSRVNTYKTPSKLEVTLYTLASYAAYPWSNILIKYELEDKSKYDFFEKEVKKLFPKAVLIRSRSDTQQKYQEAIKILEKMGDEWIFYCGNNDHPFVCSDFSVLNACLQKAKELRKEHKFISIWYSHALEGAGFLNARKFVGNHLKYLDKNGIYEGRVIFEDENMYVTKHHQNFHCSIQILHIDILKHWFFTSDLSGLYIRRTDDLPKTIDTGEQIVILPKKRICEHFDGYGNLNSLLGFSIDELVPPLFIPPGFFENNIKIAFGFDEYREGWVNINPFKSKYSFIDPKNGTDLKIGINNLPIFWKSRISKIEINPKLDLKMAERIGNENELKLATPWPTSILYNLFIFFVCSPILSIKRIVKQSFFYWNDFVYLSETKDRGDYKVRLYKNFLFFIFKLLKHLKF
ncbi:MAG: hypothetical protein QW625_02685 [Candidatus Nanoarchaeia archaeon]